MRVKDLMTKIPFHLRETDTIRTALSYMLGSKLTTLPVTDNKQKLVGVVTRSILYRLILDDMSLDLPIGPYMKHDVISLTSDTPYEQMVEVVQQSDVGTGIVVDHDQRVEGLFTKTDMIFYLLKSSTLLREQLETLLRSIQLGTLLIDSRGQIMFANAAFCHLANLTEEQVIHQSVLTLLPTLEWDVILGQSELPPPKKIALGQSQVVVQFSYSSLHNQQGIIALFQDCTQLETIAHELLTVKNLHQLLDTVLEHAYDGIVMIDQSGKINFLSQAMCELFRTTSQRTIGRPVDEVFPDMRLSQVLKTGEAEMSEVMEINGIQYLIHRIPVKTAEGIVGVIGKVMFRQLREVREIARRLDQLEKQVDYYKEQLKKHISTKFTWDHIVTCDAQIDRLKRIAGQAAKGQSTIMLRGESGTGKEMFAHAIHAASPRKSGPFITINCAAIPEQLLESELFGYESGAFTGADRAGKRGKFDLANGGTLFLDEIGDMSPHLQAKLLRVLQEKEFYRIGGTEKIEVDVRIIAATHRPLEELVESGKFREDLYYRLHVISLEIPPLRKRKEDILLLANHFIHELNTQMGTSITGLSEEVEQILLSYRWPGNIRELRNTMERAMTFAEHGKIQADDLPETIVRKVKLTSQEVSPREEKPFVSPDDTFLSLPPAELWRKRQEGTEKEMMKEALSRSNGNRSKAARILGMSRSNFYEKLKKYNLIENK